MTKTEEVVFWQKISSDVAKSLEKLKASNIEWKGNYITFKASGMDFEIVLKRKEK